MRADWRSWSNPFSLQSNSENQKMVISIFVIPYSLLITQQAGPKFQLKRHLRLLLHDSDFKKTIRRHRRACSTTASQLLPLFRRNTKGTLNKMA